MARVVVVGSGGPAYHEYSFATLAERYEVAAVLFDAPTWQQPYLTDHRVVSSADEVLAAGRPAQAVTAWLHHLVSPGRERHGEGVEQSDQVVAPGGIGGGLPGLVSGQSGDGLVEDGRHLGISWLKRFGHTGRGSRSAATERRGRPQSLATRLAPSACRRRARQHPYHR